MTEYKGERRKCPDCVGQGFRGDAEAVCIKCQGVGGWDEEGKLWPQPDVTTQPVRDILAQVELAGKQKQASEIAGKLTALAESAGTPGRRRLILEVAAKVIGEWWPK